MTKQRTRRRRFWITSGLLLCLGVIGLSCAESFVYPFNVSLQSDTVSYDLWLVQGNAVIAEFRESRDSLLDPKPGVKSNVKMKFRRAEWIPTPLTRCAPGIYYRVSESNDHPWMWAVGVDKSIVAIGAITLLLVTGRYIAGSRRRSIRSGFDVEIPDAAKGG